MGPSKSQSLSELSPASQQDCSGGLVATGGLPILTSLLSTVDLL